MSPAYSTTVDDHKRDQYRK